MNWPSESERSGRKCVYTGEWVRKDSLFSRRNQKSRSVAFIVFIQWRITLADHVRSSGQGEVKAGQEIRLVDIPVDAGYGMGAFETLHGCDNASTFSRQLTEASSKYYGTAVISFVEDLIANQEKMPEFLKECRGFAKELIPIGASGSS